MYTNKAGKVAEGCATFWRRSRYRVAARADLNMRQLFAAAASPDAARPATDASSGDSAASAGADGVMTSAASERAGSAATVGDPASNAVSPANTDSARRRHARFAPLLQALPHLAATLQQVGTIAQVLVLVPASADDAAAAQADPNGASVAATPQAGSRTNSNGALEQQLVQQTMDVTLNGQLADDQARPVGEAAADAIPNHASRTHDEEALCLVNTHLFYHPWAPHIRIMHVAAMMEEAVALAESTRRALALPRRPALLFCGDLNSDHSWGMPGVLVWRLCAAVAPNHTAYAADVLTQSKMRAQCRVAARLLHDCYCAVPPVCQSHRRLRSMFQACAA